MQVDHKKASRDAIVKDTRCWQMWKTNKSKTSRFDDIKELPWHAVRKARELELKYLRDLGVYEKVDEKEAVTKVRNHSSGHEMG